MSLYGAFAKDRHLLELATPGPDQHGVLLTAAARRNEALRNLTGNTTILASELALIQGLTATSTELNFLDGVNFGNSVVGKAALLNSNGGLRTAANVGVSAATSVVEYGDGYNHVTILTLTALALSGFTGGTLSAEGVLLYTLPAGAKMLESAYINIQANHSAATKTDEADVGLGTVIGSGAVSTLDGTSTFEDIISGQTLADTDDTDPVVIGALPTGGAPLFFASADARTIHLNIASDWADAEVAAQTLNATGTVVLVWKFLE